MAVLAPRFCVRVHQAQSISKRQADPAPKAKRAPAIFPLGERSEHFRSILPGFPECALCDDMMIRREKVKHKQLIS
jgi:hypothetical protein